MLNFLKRTKSNDDDTKASSSLFKRLKQGLSRTRTNLSEGMATALLGKKSVDSSLLDDIETLLLTADVGVEATQQIIQDFTDRISRKDLTDPTSIIDALQFELKEILHPCEQPLVIEAQHTPYVILMVGVNGSGKTTTIGKLAKQLQNEGKSVLLAAGDTFRAAAVEQLRIWGDRNNIPVIAQESGADSASVIYDALEAAKARNIDVLIADTAGRLHTQSHLMDELSKVKRVMQKLDQSAPHEVMLVLDAGIGQNAIQQTKHFDATVGITGLCVTKLDGTAKGGIIFALAKQFGFPLRYIGIGEGIDDLQTFHTDDFIEALFS